jgi:hypothetical protein
VHSNNLLFDSVVLLTNITRSPNFDPAIFKAMDKVCQLIYEKNKWGIEVLSFSPFSGDSFLRKRFGQPQDDSMGERVFRFCFEFKDELINRVEISRKFIG